MDRACSGWFLHRLAAHNVAKGKDLKGILTVVESDGRRKRVHPGKARVYLSMPQAFCSI